MNFIFHLNALTFRRNSIQAQSICRKSTKNKREPILNTCLGKQCTQRQYFIHFLWILLIYIYNISIYIWAINYIVSRSSIHSRYNWKQRRHRQVSTYAPRYRAIWKGHGSMAHGMAHRRRHGGTHYYCCYYLNIYFIIIITCFYDYYIY